MIDFEEGRISIRLSEGTFYTLQKDIANFCFFNNDGSCNENGFYNCILPTLHKNRLIDRERLRNVLKKRFSNKIKPEFKEGVFEELDDIFNTVQYEDKGMQYHNAKLDIRLSKENMKFFSPVFSLLEKQEIPKSAYIRNLLNQYSSMRTDEREYLCFVNEYEELTTIALDNVVIEFMSNGQTETLFPITVSLCRYDNELYVICLMPQSDDYILKSYRLCEFKSYKTQAITFDVPEFIMSKVKSIIAKFEYYKKPSIRLNGAK